MKKPVSTFLERRKLFNVLCQYSSLADPNKLDLKYCYKILEIPDGSDQEQIRAAYLSLAKKYHPDSGSKDANVEKFYQIDEAFRVLLEQKAKERWGKEDETVNQEQDIKHTAPQHRHYLNFDGVGVGNPFQRQKQYTTQKAMKASENVFKHRVEKVSAEENALMKKTTLKHDMKTKCGLDRLVEDLIQESMSKGEFNKLSGVGKPLKDKNNGNPYVDFVTHKLNEVLIENGFTPEWITLHKEIRDELQSMRNKLSEERRRFKAYPLNDQDRNNWEACVHKYERHVKNLNTKIDKFNLIVPILDKQIFHVNIQTESTKILMSGQYCEHSNSKVEQAAKGNSIVQVKTGSSFVGLIEALFRKSTQS